MYGFEAEPFQQQRKGLGTDMMSGLGTKVWL